MAERRYTNQPELQRRQALVESLGRRADKPGFGGLFDAFRGGKEQRALSEANKTNSSISASENEMRLQQAMSGSANAAPGVLKPGAQYQFQSPEAQQGQLAQALGNQQRDQNEERRMTALTEQRRYNESQSAITQQGRMDLQGLRNSGRTADGNGNNYGVTNGYYYNDKNEPIAERKTGRDGTTQIIDLATGQELSQPPVGRFSPNSSTSAQSLSTIASTGGAETDVEVANISATTPGLVDRSALIAQGQQSAQTTGAENRARTASEISIDQAGFMSPILEQRSRNQAIDSQSALTSGAANRGEDAAALALTQDEALASQSLEQDIERINAMSGLEADAAGMIARAKGDEELSTMEQRLVRTSEIEMELDVNRRLDKLGSSQRKNDLANEWIDEALAGSKWYTTGIANSLGAWVSGSPGFQLNSVIKSLEGVIGFDALQEMRANSKTGAALGAINEKELDQLNGIMGSIKASNGKDMLDRNLERLRQELNAIVHGEEAAFNRDYNSPSVSITDQADRILGL